MTDRSNFDVTGWMKLIGEVQQLGLDTARIVAERFSDLADSNLGSRASSTPPVDAAFSAWRNMVDEATDPQTQQQLMDAAQGMTDAMLGMMGAAWNFFSESASQTTSMAWGPGAVDLGSAGPGETTSGTVHVHVGRDEVPDEVRMRIGPLSSGPGDTLPADAVDFDPASVVDPAGGRSYPVTVTVAVPKDAAPGEYHGHLFAQTSPPSAVALRVEVTG